MQCQKNLHADALQSLKLARKLQELAHKFLYKSTYALMRWDKKTKSNPVISHNRHTVPQAKKRTLIVHILCHNKNTQNMSVGRLATMTITMTLMTTTMAGNVAGAAVGEQGGRAGTVVEAVSALKLENGNDDSIVVD